MLKTRLVTGFIGVAALLGIVLWGALPLRVAVVLVSLVMLYELLRAVKVLPRRILSVLGLLYAALITAQILPATAILPVTVLYMILLFSLCVFADIQTADAALTFFLSVFVSLFMSCITATRYLPGGAYYIWMIFIGAWVSDTCAYTFGRLFGRHKLIPAISPKKTVEGAVGGVLGTALGFVIYGMCVKTQIADANFLHLALMGAAASVAGQLGDLAASAIKRRYGIKDYGKCMPGHGGMMDRFDSILFVAPVVYYYLVLFMG